MKIVLAIINDQDAFLVMDLLSKNGFGATKLASTGGFLKSGNTTLICGVDESKVEDVINIIEKKSKSRKMITSDTQIPITETYNPNPIEIVVGGATIFVLDVEQFKKL